MKQPLKLSNLKNLDLGKVDAAFTNEVKKVVADMVDRPGDSTPRSIVLKFDFTPEAINGVCETAGVEFALHTKLPPKKTRRYSMGVHPAGGLIFNPESPENVHQGTLDES